jgi:type II secretory pathway pseudopilin PulG
MNQELRIMAKKNKIKSIIHDSLFMIHSKGFTLIELLASVVVIVAIGLIIAGITSSSLRGANKTNTIENIRQNGNYVLNQMSKDIEYALPFDGKNTGLGYDDAESKVVYTPGCPPFPLKYIAVQSASNNIVTEYSCISSPYDLKANGKSLVDEVISLRSCSFACTQANDNNVPVIQISFTLEPKNPSGLAENNSSSAITFETAVTVRNYSR